MSSPYVPLDLETMSHAARVRKAVELGRQARTDPEAARLLAEWRAGGFTQRLLATMACHGSRDVAALVALCDDPSRRIAGLALATLRTVGDDDALLAVLRALPGRRLARTLARLRQRRPNVVDAAVAERLAAGDPAGWALVALGSAELVERHLDEASERGGHVFWGRLAVRHPDRAASAIVARLETADRPDGVLFADARAVVAGLAGRNPPRALKVIEALARHVPLAQLPLRDLARRLPGPVADLVLASAEPAYVSFEPVAHRLGTARLVALAERGAQLVGRPEVWLAKLPPADRAAVYDQLAPDWGKGGVVPVEVIRRLPADRRADAARSILRRPILAARPLERLPYAALLPWDEARGHAETWLGHPEAEYRAAALAALCEATRFDRSRLADLLELLGQRQHEQDPVRLAFLSAVAALPPGRWRAEHLPGLAQIVRAALDAADLSPGSVAALGRLAFALLPVHPEWAVERLEEVTRERGFPAGGLGRLLGPDDVRRIAPALSPLLSAWLDRERVWALLGLAGCVGRWLPLWPALAEKLERLLADPVQYVASAALALLLDHARADRDRVVTALLADDPSWVLHPGVLAYLHRHRQDLLTPYLGQRAYKGRFSTGKVRRVLPLVDGFHRWTDAQQETFADALAEVARPPARKRDSQPTHDVLTAVRALAALPAIGPERLVALADDRRPAVRETAVRALGRLDARQGIPALLVALGDDRARWAVYAVRQALRDLPGERILAVLRDVPLRKVTVAKEAVRLAGEFGGPAALAWFEELDGRKLHRDVRGALLRALWDHLDDPRAWPILDRSAGSPEVGVVIGLARVPLAGVAREGRRRVAGLFRKLLDHPDATVRVAVLDRLAVEPVADPSGELLAASLAKLASAVPDERSAGLRAALRNARETDAATVAAAFGALLDQGKELAEAVEEFVAHTAGLGDRLRPIRSAVLAAVEAAPTRSLLRARLAVAGLPPADLAAWVGRLAESSHWHVGTQVELFDALAASHAPPAELSRIESALARSADGASRWLAFRLLVLAAERTGWTATRRNRLTRYQADAHPAVAESAGATFPPEPE